MSEGWRDPAVAEQWGALAGKLPTREEQLDIALAELEAADLGDQWILDLGVGPGIVAEQVLERLPEARIVGADVSERMLELAAGRLKRFGGRFEPAHVDLEAEDPALPERDYAAALAVQSLHNVEPLDQVRAIRLLSETLAPGAVFVVVDKVAIPPAAYPLFVPVWRRLERLSGFLPEPHTYPEHVALLEREGDRPIPLERLLQWLREAEFEPAVLHVHGNRAVVAARRR
jgi:tRNA (cmo5U34)-methyltransferase